jgi:hypothetical protein
MGASTRRILTPDRAIASVSSNVAIQIKVSESETHGRPDAAPVPAARPSVFVAADDRLLREALEHMLMKRGNFEVRGMELPAPWVAE